MIKKLFLIIFIFFSIASVGVNGVRAEGGGIAKSSFLAGLWQSFTGRVSLLFKSTWDTLGTPFVRVKNPTGQTMGDAAKSGQNQGQLYIPGKFGFGGSGGVITSTPFPISTDKPRTDVSNIGNAINNPKNDITPTPNKGYPAPDLKPVPPQLIKTDNRLPIHDVKVSSIPSVTTPVGAGKISSNQILSLNISSSQNLDNIIEGDVIKFKASLKLSDGTLRDVSNEVKWSVLGDIGSISVGGSFTAKLGVTRAEFGEGVGSIVSMYTSIDGKSFVASQILKVSFGGVDENIGDIGGQ